MSADPQRLSQILCTALPQMSNRLIVRLAVAGLACITIDARGQGNYDWLRCSLLGLGTLRFGIDEATSIAVLIDGFEAVPGTASLGALALGADITPGAVNADFGHARVRLDRWAQRITYVRIVNGAPSQTLEGTCRPGR
jgi:hypothetical protein